MTVVYVCECGHEKDQHAGGAYACRECDCKGYRPDFSGESTSAKLRRVEQERDELKGKVRAAQRDRDEMYQALYTATWERDQLSEAVAGWVARFHAAYEALAIEEFDGDSCPDLETTIEYAIGAYRRVCKSEAEAADEITKLRAELAAERERHAILLRLERHACALLRQRLSTVRAAADLANAELATARAELERLRAQPTDSEGEAHA